MPLRHRLEAIAPIEKRPLRDRLRLILQTLLNDRRHAWTMDSNDRYTQLQPESDAELGTHAMMMNLARQEALVTPEELMLLR